MTTQVCETSEPRCAIQQASQQKTANWSGVLAMSLCVFALVASEFMPVSLLTPIATDLNVSEGLVGQGIAISGFFAVLTSLSIASIAKDTDRRSLLLGLTSLMLVSGIVIAYAPNYAVYMLGRSLIGVVIGGFWSLSGASAIRLVPKEKLPKALAIFNGGNALAMVIAAPLGSYLGAHIGWRGAFFGLVPAALIAFVWMWFSLPAMKPETRVAGSANVFSLLNKPLVRLGMLAIVLLFMGQFALFTYVRPFLETAIHVESNSLSFILLMMGIAGFMGTLLVSLFLKNNLYRTLIFIPLVMAVIALALILFSDSSIAVTTLLVLWGGVATAAPVAWWTWLARTMPEDSEVGDLVGVGCIVDSCKHCHECIDDQENYCDHMVGTYNGLTHDAPGHTLGGYAEQIVVDERYVLRISHPQAQLAAVAPLLCAGITTYSPLRHWHAGPGKKVGIVGIGGLGHMGIKLAHAMGAHVVAFTTSESKRDAAKALGADEVVVSKNADEMAKHLQSLDLIVNTVAAPHDLDAFLSLLKRDGTMTLVGAPATNHPSPNAFNLIMKRRSLAGSMIGGIRETQEMLDFCAAHNIVSDIELIRADEINTAYERMLKGDVKYRFVIDNATLAR